MVFDFTSFRDVRLLSFNLIILYSLLSIMSICFYSFLSIFLLLHTLNRLFYTQY
nr:MAG TPA: hypothetical protein [Caudoviricetes sp.]DAZ14564.1 MAG TPA: hypothetical protein [Caudoviricetes sp.]